MPRALMDRRCLHLLCLLLIFLTTISGAMARPSAPEAGDEGRAKARQLFREGGTLFDQGDYSGAIQRFQAAFALYPSPNIHARIAACYIWLGRPLKALEHYEAYLELSADTTPSASTKRLREQVTKEVEKILGQIAQVRVRLPGPAGAELRVNGNRVGTAPYEGSVRLEAGRCSVIVLANGFYPFRRDVKLRPGEILDLPISLVAIKPKVIEQVKVVHAPPVYHRWWFWTAIGVLVAGGATALGVTYGSRENLREPGGVPLWHDSFVRR